jgi:internalin A
MTQRQSATVLAFLAVLYVGALVLWAPQLEFLSGESEFSWVAGAAAGLVIASPTYLAIWAVHGRQCATVRLPLTTWLCVVFLLAAVYGEVRYFGGGDADLVALILLAWITAYLTHLLLLRLLRAVRGWRLVRLRSTAASDAPQSPLDRKHQFTIRTVLIWTSAAATLFAGLRWLAPYGVFDSEELQVQFLDGVLVDGVLFGLILALAGLPVVSLSLVVLTDGRRIIWRGALLTFTALGIAGGSAAFQWWLGDREMDIAALALAIETGVLMAGVAAASITRACDYRLVRQRKGEERPAPDAPLDLPAGRKQFAFAVASLVMASLALACYAPRRLETWRRADETGRWELLGWYAEFDDEGRIRKLISRDECDLEGTKSLLAHLSHLESLDLPNSEDCDALLAALPALPDLKNLSLSGACDGGLSRLDRFPNLEELTLFGDGVTDARLKHLGDLPKLRTLYLGATAVQLEECPHLSQLETLNLQVAAVGDAGMSHLDRFPNLKQLDLRGTNVTDRGLAGLRALKSLTSLNLQLTEVSDAGMGSLAQLSQLKSLDVQLTAVGETGLVKLHQALPDAEIKGGASDALLDAAIFAQVATTTRSGKTVTTVIRRGGQVTMLKRLHARGNYPMRDEDGDSEPMTVTDAGVALLSGQTEMEELDLRESGVTDVGLASLGKLTKLKRLDLRGTQVTEDGCQQLAKTLTGCEILR